MIFHVSIPADNTQLVAEVIAEIWGGEAFEFPPWPGAWVAIAGDENGTTCEVYPRSQTMAPGKGDEDPVWPKPDESPSKYVAFHFATSTEKSQEEIMAIARRHGWRTVSCPRGEFFDVIEVWVENRLHVEVLTPAMQEDYRKNVNMEMWAWTKKPKENIA
ncbi:hypothetical protein [Nocardioides sp. NPDC006303]|uniref:hypothetical protein n=1 Tax=unclassified Nocardioides TaxID=2615069 RepID=UPI00324A6FD0